MCQVSIPIREVFGNYLGGEEPTNLRGIPWAVLGVAERLHAVLQQSPEKNLKTLRSRSSLPCSSSSELQAEREEGRGCHGMPHHFVVCSWSTPYFRRDSEKGEKSEKRERT
jgi:hypothetical protein